MHDVMLKQPIVPGFICLTIGLCYTIVACKLNSWTNVNVPSTITVESIDTYFREIGSTPRFPMLLTGFWLTAAGLFWSSLAIFLHAAHGSTRSTK